MPDAYRCEECRGEVNRCTACRAQRQAAKLDRQRAARSAGTCIDCPHKAQTGFVRCKLHRAQNNAISSAAHKRARSG